MYWISVTRIFSPYGALGVAGSTAPYSGTEHLVSHLLDMSAVQLDRPFAFHGAQVGVATVPVAAA
jgi:glycerol-1-phosphate dehydrogenase [NAD(P)+]